MEPRLHRPLGHDEPAGLRGQRAVQPWSRITDLGVGAHPRSGVLGRPADAGRPSVAARFRPRPQSRSRAQTALLVDEHRRSGGTRRAGPGPRNSSLADRVRRIHRERRHPVRRRPGHRCQLPAAGAASRGLLLPGACDAKAVDRRRAGRRQRVHPDLHRCVARPQAVLLGYGRRRPALAGVAVRAGVSLPRDPGRSGHNATRAPSAGGERRDQLGGGLRTDRSGGRGRTRFLAGRDRRGRRARGPGGLEGGARRMASVVASRGGRRGATAADGRHWSW